MSQRQATTITISSLLNTALTFIASAGVGAGSSAVVAAAVAAGANSTSNVAERPLD